MMLSFPSSVFARWLLAGGLSVAWANVSSAENLELTTLTGRIATYSVATKASLRPELMFGFVGALIAHGLHDGQPRVEPDYRIYDIQTEAGPTLYVVSKDEFEGSPCVEVTAPTKAIEKGFLALGTAKLREIANCAALKPIPPVSETDIRQKPGRPN